MTDRPQFNLHMAARDYVITWGMDGDFICEDLPTQEYIENLFGLYVTGYSYSPARTIVAFVDTLNATWVNKPKVIPIELNSSKIF